MRSLSWLGWAALTSAAGIIYLALVLVPGPDPGPQLADLTAAGEESEAPGEPDGPKLEPIEVIDLAQVPNGPFLNTDEPPLADPPAGGVRRTRGPRRPTARRVSDRLTGSRTFWSVLPSLPHSSRSPAQASTSRGQFSSPPTYIHGPGGAFRKYWPTPLG